MKNVASKSCHSFADSLPILKTTVSREEIQAYFENTWHLTETLFSALKNDPAFYARPLHNLRHPMIFYYGHTASLYVNKLRVAGVMSNEVNSQYEKLFETGVDEMRWDNLSDDKTEWPSMDETRKYRAKVYNTVVNIIKTHPLLDTSVTQDNPMWALFMSFEHERIHLETSSVLLRELPLEYLRRPADWPDDFPVSSPAPKNEMIKVASTSVKLGKPADYPTFGWDNEYGSEERQVRAFSASKYLISNAEFYEFVKSGGYLHEEYWSHEGWAWRSFRNTKFPTFWIAKGVAGLHEYKLRNIFEVIEMPWSWPVNINFHEAKAFCTWKTVTSNSEMPYRLLTESEHNALRDDGEYNFNLNHGSENPVNAMPANSKGFHDVFGNVWQWCEDHFHPLSGFKPHSYYDDFSVPCYDGEHHMILGGSFISTGDMTSRFARFHFRPHFFQHAGFRIAKSDDNNPASDAIIITKGKNTVYETKEMLDRYMLMHFGSYKEIFDDSLKGFNFPEVVNLPVKCAEIIKKYASNFDSALDLGSAVGGASFQMAKIFENVVGIDYSPEFIKAAEALRSNGELQYQAQISGNQLKKLIAKVDISNNWKIRFEQGDAMALPLNLKNFDCVLMSNLLCRLNNPEACLKRLSGANGLVKKGGILMITTPFSWFESCTPKASWITDLQQLKQHLPNFQLMHTEELPFVIREHQRKFEYIITLASVWKRVE